MSSIAEELQPMGKDELWETFHQTSGSINKHLPLFYSFVTGLNAQRVMDLGIGSTTRTLRAAIAQTGGTLDSCDIDKKRFEPLLSLNDPKWKVHLCDSETFLKELEPPFDFCLHDAAHDYAQTKRDMELILPMMRQFSLVCIHDTQHENCGREMVSAIQDVIQNFSVSYTHIPYCYGLTILRVEESPYEFSAPPWSKGGEWPGTVCFPDAPGKVSLTTQWTGRIKAVLRNIKRSITS